MTSQEFGELIRTHREAKELSIEDLALRFKLSVSIVRGIEEGSLDHMPHAVYAKGFVRAYAQAVDIAPEDLQAGLAALFPEEMFTDPLTVPSPVSGRATSPKRGGPGSPIFFSLLALLLVGVAGWYLVMHFDSLKRVASQYFSAASPESDSSRVSAAVTAGPGPDPALAAPAAAPESATAAQPATDAPPAAATQPAAEERPVPPPAVAAPPVAAQEGLRDAQGAAPVVTATAPPAALPAGEKQLSIDAIEECWMQVSVDGGGTRTYTVYPGETSVLPYKTKLVVVLGNAGGVVLTHNGKPYAHTSRPNEKKTFTFQ